MWVFMDQPFADTWQKLKQMLLAHGQVVMQPPHAMKTEDPDWANTIELQNVSLEMKVPLQLDVWQHQIKPNLPWAEDHFQERVSGEPLNPAPSEEYWPYAVAGNSAHKDGVGQFSHTYPERMWPKDAGYYREKNYGVRFEYGDLADLVESMRKDPRTRQAYLPIWFPEDTGMSARTGERVPCSLGYHFMDRGQGMQCTYYLRSCDFRRYFADDVYMAGRLLQWVAEEVQGWNRIMPAKLIVHIASLHVFQGDLPAMRLA